MSLLNYNCESEGRDGFSYYFQSKWISICAIVKIYFFLLHKSLCFGRFPGDLINF